MGEQSREWLEESVDDLARRAISKQPYPDVCFVARCLLVAAWSILYHSALVVVVLYFSLFQVYCAALS